MKQLLLEKFLLNEKLILTEDLADDAYAYVPKIKSDAGAKLVNIIAKIEELIDKSGATTYKTAVDLINKLKEIRQKIDDADKKINNEGLTEIITLMTSPEGYIALYQNLLNTCLADKSESKLKDDADALAAYRIDKKNKTKINSQIEVLQNTCAKTGLTDADKQNRIISKYKLLNGYLDATTDNILHIDDFQAKANVADTFKKSVDTIKSYAEEGLPDKYLFDLETIKAADNVKVRNYRDALNAVSKAITDILAINTKVDYNSRLKRIEALGTAFSALKSTDLAKALDAKELDDKKKDSKKDFDDKLKSGTKRDWAALYSKYSKGTKEEQEQFWDTYFKEEWGDAATQVRNFGPAFIQELKRLGWDPITNPLIAFLKENIALVKGGKIDKLKWEVIHNAVANHTLSKDDLKKIGIFKDANIIFNKKLFDKSAGDIENYLELQHASEKLSYNGKDNVIAKFKADAPKVLMNIMYTEGDGLNLDVSITDGTFRSITEIREILELANEKGNDEGLPADDALITALLRKVGTDANLAAKLVAYLWFVWRAKYSNELDKVDKENCGKNISNNFAKYLSPNAADWDKYHAFLELNRDYSKDRAKQLLLELARIAGWVVKG